MPAHRREGAPAHNKLTKTYGGTVQAAVGASVESQVVSPANPRRTMLLIQNTGAQDLLVRFGAPCLDDGSDLTFPAASSSGLLWDRADTCPEAAIYIASPLGTTYSITEQITK